MISSCWVHEISTQGIEQLESFFGPIFHVFPMKVARVYLDSSCGKFPALGPWWQPCKYFYTINSKVEVCAMIGGFLSAKYRVGTVLKSP